MKDRKRRKSGVLGSCGNDINRDKGQYELWLLLLVDVFLKPLNFPLYILFYAYEIFGYKYVCVPSACLVPEGARRGCWILELESQRALSFHVGAGG